MLVFALAPTLFKRRQWHRSAEALISIQFVFGQAKMAKLLQFSRHAWITNVVYIAEGRSDNDVDSAT